MPALIHPLDFLCSDKLFFSKLNIFILVLEVDFKMQKQCSALNSEKLVWAQIVHQLLSVVLAWARMQVSSIGATIDRVVTESAL